MCWFSPLRFGHVRKRDSSRTDPTFSVRFVNELCFCESVHQKDPTPKNGFLLWLHGRASVRRAGRNITKRKQWLLWWTGCEHYALHYVIIKSIVYSFSIKPHFQHFWGQRTRMRWVYYTSNCVTAVMNKWNIKKSAGMNTIGVSFLDPLDDYEIIHQIGSGTYGDVFKVRMKVIIWKLHEVF